MPADPPALIPAAKPLPSCASQTVAHAPGKLILSGEHAVLYGAPALAMAVARYTEVSLTQLSGGTGLQTAFAQVSNGATYPLGALADLKEELDKRHLQFQRGERAVEHILRHPDDLAIYTLAALVTQANSFPLSNPGPNRLAALLRAGELNSVSDLPIGAGMGSSAAVVAATTLLFETLRAESKPPEERVAHVRFCERLKHGNAGPIDAATVIRGGVMRVAGPDARPERVTLPEGHSLLRGAGWYWVVHGIPLSGTGECVSTVAKAHGQNQALWRDFAACVEMMQHNLLAGADLRPAMRLNHRLLDRLGVVPKAAGRFIAEVEALGGAAKICGAGAVRGDHAGALLVHVPDPPAMVALMARHPTLAWGDLRLSPGGAAAGPAPDRPKRVADG